MKPFARRPAAAEDEDLAFLREVAEGVHGIEALFDHEVRLRWISPSIERVTGCSPADCLAAPDLIELLVHESDRNYCRGLIARVMADGLAQDFELRLVCKDGRVIWVASHWRRVVGGEGRSCALRLSAEDIQSRKETEYKLLETVAELRRAQALREHYLLRSNDERQRLAALLNLIRLGILFMDHDGRVLYYNRAMLEIWRYPLDANLIGTRERVLQETVASQLADPQAYFAHIVDVISSHQRLSDTYTFEFADGRVATDRSAVVEGTESGHGIGRVWIYEDVTEAHRISARLVELAEHDALTGLYNRRRFHEELDRMLADAVRRDGEVGLLALDLDGFKPINDAFGHQAGDEVLVRMAESVRRIVRRNEMFFRVGGDEFALLVPDADAEALAELATRLVEAVASLQFEFASRPVGVTASVGIARFPVNAADAEALIGAADEAMYRSKNEGRNRWTMSGRSATESAKIGVPCSDEPDRNKD
jgi:diguanylate cyclase